MSGQQPPDSEKRQNQAARQVTYIPVPKTESNQNEARISETLASVIEQVWNEAEKKGIDIEAIGFDELDPDSNVTVPVGEDDLFAILRNLMENAVKYCPKGSTVTIE